MRAVGLMSGTSLDGIDAAYVDIAPRGAGYAVETLHFVHRPFDRLVRERLERALPPHDPPLREIADLDRLIGAALGAAAATAAHGEPLDFVASHGLTLYHDGASGRTWQIGNPFEIRERVAASVAYDFRRADCAAGGHGAPLVPFVDALLFGGSDRTIAALNLGGIANATIVRPGATPTDVLAWDIGPANMLLDAFVTQRTGGAERYDAGGARALRGTVVLALLERLLADEYFALAPPKSTGRERFGAPFVDRFDLHDAALAFEDGCATLAALTADSVARDLTRAAPDGARVVASGGGVHNAAVMGRLAERLGPRFDVETSAAFGVDPDAKEAIAFAVLGYEVLRGRVAGLPNVTGARHAALLGALAPHGLEDVLARVRAETEGR